MEDAGELLVAGEIPEGFLGLLDGVGVAGGEGGLEEGDDGGVINLLGDHEKEVLYGLEIVDIINVI